MNNSRQAGAMNLLAIPLVLVVIMLFVAAFMAFNFYSEAESAKTNSSRTIALAVDKAEQETSTRKEQEFAEKLKSPYDRYDGPSQFGALRILYPKNWSAYVSEAGKGGKPVEGWFAPNFVPATNNTNNTFALRVVVETRTYDTILKEYAANVKTGKVTVRPYQSPNVPNVVGSRIDGEIAQKKQGTMIVMPMRDKTLRLWTESRDYVADFDNIILPGFSFAP